ncbi:SAM-dependent methyltransferase [Bacillus sp. SM2101]|uniref:SAM-dependent methyltransferase n=1 Tax=Bacillus sp. SM2101 TaxID=2805366 RepID=UPI001BDEFFF6|nr:SAM-dependent methyltransferase [Bacillus sp. SM2101]
MSIVEQSTKLDLERIIFIGRTFKEYMDMFSFSEDDLSTKKILDCPAGACSFAAIGEKVGLNITACDIVYDYSVEALKGKGLRDIAHAMKHMEQAKSNYIWNYFGNLDGLRKHRESALYDCTTHMKQSSDRYISATLPTLPFANEQFDITLSAHFLFMYADRLDYDFHIETIDELLRVTKDEVRIFPLLDLEGTRYEHIDRIINSLTAQGYKVDELSSNYEFQKNANSMLKIIK